jgi:TM2 domain-containing membrane protein YozV
MNQEQVKTSNSGNAMKAALLSALVVPGAGQIFNRQWSKGIVIAILFLIASLAVLVAIGLMLVGYYISLSAGNVEGAANSIQKVTENWISLLFLTVMSVVLYIYSIVDAYRQSQKQSTQEKSDE